jgi:phage terminase large subunit GpA-like protein
MSQTKNAPTRPALCYNGGKWRIAAPCPDGVTPGVLCFNWPLAARRVWRRPEIVPVSIWAEKNRTIDIGARPGPWNNSVARYLCGPMDVYFLPFIREIVIIAPPQTGKTEIMLNCMGSLIDQMAGPTLFVYDQQELAKHICTTRGRNVIIMSTRLRKYLTGKSDDLANFSMKLQHMTINFAWATSVSQLSSKPIQHLFMDEVDKYESTGKREAGPVSLARMRTRQFRYTSKTLLASSPSTDEGEITVAFNRVQARFEYAVRCPDCSSLGERGVHVMQFSGKNGAGVVWPKDIRDPETIHARELANYVCPDCGSIWDNYKRDIAVQKGFWREKETHIELVNFCKRYRPRSVGFQYSALIAPFVSLSDTAANFVLSQQELKAGRVDAYKNWVNNYMAETWKEDFAPRKSAAILALRDERPAGVLPSIHNVAVLVAAIDTQDDGFPYEIRAFGYGQETESWQVRTGFAQSFEELDKILWIEYYDIDGNPCVVALAGIDSQGHRTREVLEWCIFNRGRTLPLSGEQTMKQQYKLFPQEFWPGTTTKIPGGLQRLHINTKYYKDALHRKLEIPTADPGAWHLNSECSEAWAEQMCAEYLDERQVWVCPKGRPNHAWDVSVYNFCIADYLGTRFMQPDNNLHEETVVENARPISNGRLW